MSETIAVDPARSSTRDLSSQTQKHYSISDLSQVYSLLLRTPTREFISGLTSGTFFDDLEDILRELDLNEPTRIAEIQTIRQYCASQDEETLLHILRREYTRMFIKTSKNPEVDICEALFVAKRDGVSDQPLMFVNPEAMALSATYRKIGIIRSSEFNYPEDHFAFQFAFRARIHQALGLAGEQHEHFMELLREYNQKHFERWAADFFSVCEAACNVEVYQVFWRLGYGFSKMLTV